MNSDTPNDGIPPKEDFDDLGTIQVIVLRCKPPGNSPTLVSATHRFRGSTTSSLSSVFEVDVASDRRSLFGLGGPSDWGSGSSWNFGYESSQRGFGGKMPGQWSDQLIE